MFEGLDDIPWATLRHNYGTAENIPGLLRAAARGETTDVNDALHNQLVHQGGWVCPAATAALPYVLDLLELPEAAERDELALLVAHLAQTANSADPKFVDDGWHEAWAAAFPRVVGLLGDPDEEVRDCLTWAVGESVQQRDEAFAALKARFEAETTARVRTTVLEGVRDLGGEAAGAWLRGAAGRRTGMSAAAIVAAHELDGTTVDAAGLAAVVAALGSDAWETLHSVRSGDSPALTPGDRATVAEALIAHPDGTRRALAVRLANRLLAEHRGLDDRLISLLTGALDDEEIRGKALAVLAAVAAPLPDRYAEHLDDPSADVAEAALWALVRTGDARCVPVLCAAITDGGRHTRGHDSLPHVWSLPSLGELAELVPDALVPELLPAVRAKLAAGPHAARLDYLNTLVAWGTRASAARPEVEGLIGTEADALAGQALDAIAPSTPSAPEAAELSDPDSWKRTRAAHRSWRATGEVAVTARVLIDVVEEALGSPRALPVGRAAIAHLAEMGAAEAKPLARRVLAEDRRLHYFGGWRVFTEDEAWRRAAERILEA